MKKLKLKLETIAILNSTDLQHAQGGASFVIVRTHVCPVLSNGCTGGGCVMTQPSASDPTPTIQSSFESSILPSGG